MKLIYDNQAALHIVKYTFDGHKVSQFLKPVEIQKNERKYSMQAKFTS